jgi:anti-sigma B factor antagonist
MTVVDGVTSPGPQGEPDGELSVAVRTHEPDEVVVLAASGEVDLLTVRRLRESIERALAEAPRLLVVDLTGVSFFGSSGLAVLVEFRQVAGSRTELRVVATGPSLRALQVTGLSDVFAVHPTLEDALGNA